MMSFSRRENYDNIAHRLDKTDKHLLRLVGLMHLYRLAIIPYQSYQSRLQQDVATNPSTRRYTPFKLNSELDSSPHVLHPDPSRWRMTCSSFFNSCFSTPLIHLSSESQRLSIPIEIVAGSTAARWLQGGVVNIVLSVILAAVSPGA